MSRHCQLTGRRPGFGNALSYSHRRTRRRWEPNPQTRPEYAALRTAARIFNQSTVPSTRHVSAAVSRECDHPDHPADGPALEPRDPGGYQIRLTNGRRSVN
jgi:ribosomal protein L28